MLIANRGEIACRVIRTLREMGIGSVALYVDADADASHVWAADEAVSLGEDPRAYLDIDKVIAAAQKTGATAVHPGYGFLSENGDFARALAARDIVFIGPSPESMAAFGDKSAARTLAEKYDVPVIPGAQEVKDSDAAKEAAMVLGFPVLLKASAGGGGKGIRIVHEESEFEEAFSAASREAVAAFGDGRMLVERYIFPSRHIEVQLLGDGEEVVALGERECSLQRRYQKIIEESPSAAISQETRDDLFTAAIRLAMALNYKSSGTVEFLVAEDGSFYFLEVNTRLQVEHPVTELVTGLDLVAEQIKIAHGGKVPKNIEFKGHAIEGRINAEMVYDGFLPATGEILMLEWPHHPRLRVDAGIRQGSVVTPHFDPMLAKMISWGQDREEARSRLIEGLQKTTILGLQTNQSFLIDLLKRDFFIDAKTFTTTVEEETFERPEAPAVALFVGEEATGMAPRKNGGDGGTDGDNYSPWQSAAKLRIGL
ncbi:ATP-grasp domain-containing protein [Myxococcota bacterium]|nr:ATP-grasp domain-containing protein [Myxococcota bacterium]